MNRETWSPKNGPTVRNLSPQVTGTGPRSNSGTNSYPSDHHPRRGWSGGDGPFQIIHCNTDQNIPENEPASEPEPTDEELWLEDVACQVEADARPLFAMALAYLFRRALELDEDEPA